VVSTSIPAGTFVLLVGTKRGLFTLTSPDRTNWTVAGESLRGTRVFNAILDQRGGNPRIFATDNGDFFGTFLKYSDDFGSTWQEPKEGIQFPEDTGRKLINIWIIQPGRPEEPDVLYVGVDPASLWKSTDRGETWSMVRGLEEHPTRDEWGPGAGGLCLHSIVPDHSDPDRMWIGISAVGCMRTEDGGKTWTHVNKNTRNDFLPDRYPEFGQCIHRLVQHPTEPDTLYQQNHCGVYMSANGATDWQDIQTNLPSSFGFPIALDVNQPETLFTIVEDGMARTNVDGHFTVYRTEKPGDQWQETRNGLPEGANVRLGVLRHGMCADTSDPCGVYVGTNTGQLFASADRGESWNMICDFLPAIYSVNVAVVQ
jgi:photosystem II stability/assembly factor-like uncharacterized protein